MQPFKLRKKSKKIGRPQVSATGVACFLVKNIIPSPVFFHKQTLIFQRLMGL